MKIPKLITAAALSFIGFAAAFPAQAALTITSATWDGKKLVVKGTDGKGDGVEVFYGYDTPPNSTSLGTASVKGNGRWKLQVNSNRNNPLDPVPCAVSATLAGDLPILDFPVDGADPNTCSPQPPGGNNPPVASDDNFVVDTTVIDRNGQADITAPGVLINDTDPDPADTVEATPASGTTTAGGTYDLLADGSFSYVPPTPDFTGDDSFSYTATDGTDTSAAATVNLPVQTGLLVNTTDQNQFNILMNYELGMHCTGFEFAYCCVLPPYNSIIAQVVKTDKGANDSDFPKLLEGDPVNGLDLLGRETVLRDPQLDGNGDFNKYVMRYWHEAQPRNDGRGKAQSSTLISAVEANSLFMWNTVYDAADTDAGNNLITGTYQGSTNVVLGDGDYTDANDNYGSGWMNHFYIYADLEGSNPANTSAEVDKIRLGLENLNASTALSLVVPPDCGPAFHPVGPDTQNGVPGATPVANDCGGFSNGNLLTFSTDHGTVVFTQMKVLENLPVMLTSPRMWEALGLPLTPFEDTIDFFADPGLVDEDSIRPFVQMKAQMYHFDGGANDVPVIDDGNPVIGFGTAPIDIPNCERCHSELADTSQNSAQQENGRNSDVAALVQQEMDFWNAFYNIDPSVDSTWYSRLKGAAISILAIHDKEHGTSFTANYPGDPNDPSNPGFGSGFPQNTRLGNESVICQKCHADSVIAVVKSANCGPDNELGTTPCAEGTLIPPMTEAIHDNHRNVSDDGIIVFADSLGRDGGCQGCHPAHRSDGDMAGYPITEEGDNFYANDDNRDASGGCFVGRDVHSNPFKDTDGADTPEHLNPVGAWLSQNVFSDQGPNGDKG
ncbi:MAG: Ig-like domain-containing protein, partial [Pseudomonadota bacterium]|nr:Ig-like domain-containing protein [Pseudomonadota bacterium]